MKTQPLALAAVALAGILAFTGCTPEKPAPKPTTTQSQATTTKAPEKLDEPKTAEDAIDGARSAYQAFLKARSEAFVDPSKIGALKDVSTGQALDRTEQAVTQIKEKGLKFSGSFEFEFKSGVAGRVRQDGKEDIRFGSVELEVCMDTTGMDAKKADGSPGTLSDVRRWIMKPQVIFDRKDQRWLVSKFEDPNIVVPC